MSDTRPPITAGPIERAFKFLKSTSVSGSGAGEGVAVAEGDDVSCADKVEMAQLENQIAQKNASRVVMRGYLRVASPQGKRFACRFWKRACARLRPAESL